MNTLVWFRSDLRADDNSALQAAKRAGGAIHGLFLAAPEQWRRHQWGPRRQAFVWQQVLALRTELASRGIPLHVEVAPRFTDAAQHVLTTARRVGAAHVLASAEYATDELVRDATVAATLAECGLKWQSLHQFTALAPGTVRTRAGGPFRVFSAFRREWLAQARRMTIGGVDAVRVSAPVEPPRLPDWHPPQADVDSSLWPAGERTALRRLGKFISTRLDRYDVDRDFPARDGTSRLSPYLSTGTLSVRRCFEAALAANGGEWDSGCAGACTWINELIWREFYVHVLQAFPAVSRHRALRPETEGIRWRAPGDELVRWQRGLTGFPLVDAGMRELAATGWMHNRVRMMTATFLSKHLLIDWRHGERHFMHELLDGDLAANNGGWQWCASSGTDAVPYFRVMSPARQAVRFDAEGEYIRRHLPELASCSTRALHAPGHPELLVTGYPAPIVDSTQARERAVAAYRDAAAGHPRCA